ncbi:AbiTii domain-containing protein [Aequorivita vladivostokensis]|uniref:AbiTii domain-containing protein n=1 Tax=Aequorivita vladivostokensis TaxID=171194 RepID=A0ABR5DEQ9_9FLAO|nr:hypothetical protein [Aequorivita vladivostokensis]KJJ37254.1 hypothetical protein MB09_15375 [Aequorivita vladivostokensis]
MTEKTNNTFILNNVINDLIDAEKSLINPLMKLNYFGRITKNKELTEYTLNEIKGYSADSKLPDYRKIGARLYVDFQAGWNSHPNKELPVAGLDKDIQEFCNHIRVYESIREIENMNLKFSEKDSHYELKFPLPLQLLPQIQPFATRLYKSDIRMQVTGARLIGNSSKMMGITETVRTNLLAFSMEIAEQFGYEIELTDYNKQREENNKTILQYMTTNNITTSGDGNIINTGDKAKIEANINISKGNKEELAKYLQENGISPEDTAELVEIIDTEEPNPENKTFGKKVSDWTKKMIGKAVDGGWNVGIGAAGSLLAEAIGKYYGF